MRRSNVKHRQFWQQHNKPAELWTAEVIDQKVEYIHNNPVMAGFVNEPHHWKYSSGIDYSGGKGLLEIDFVWLKERAASSHEQGNTMGAYDQLFSYQHYR